MKLEKEIEGRMFVGVAATASADAVSSVAVSSGAVTITIDDATSSSVMLRVSSTTRISSVVALSAAVVESLSSEVALLEELDVEL